ncbi:putative virulence factor [Glaesserella sp.]|uniref:putative virulence factor n=1 Tax=Glaesserella sp. TaxID=2094731 RepID=UPI00359F16A0
MSNAEQLTTSWNQVFDGAKNAIKWVSDTRSQSQRLDNEADRLTLELRRLRNTAKRLGTSSGHPVTAGFFGLSQAGKSYLISALAADNQGKLQTIFDGKTLDFVEHINPEGGGKEATGLVTRFSRNAAASNVPGYPLKLQIFNEIEIAKILINSFFNDFDKEKLDYACDQQKVNEILKKVSGKVAPNYTGGLTEESVVDLQDYAMDNFGKSLSTLNANYWAKATVLAPKLAIEDRATLFSILWGEFNEFNDIYIKFAKTLATLKHPSVVYAPLSAVVKKNEGGGISKADSIMNVDMVERLGTSRDEQIQVRPQLSEGEIGEPVIISLSELTILTAELIFPLMNQTRVPAVEHIDLLDFPGYRGRLNITQITSDNPVSQLILRGKVAYLFERYTDSQEMNILIMCTPSNSQIEVNDVGPVLERWIDKSQGETPEIRSERKPGLLWAVTKFDIRIQDKLTTTEENLRISWGSDGLLKQTILERFGHYEWFKNWNGNKPFNNMFLVRKPGFKVPFLNVEGNNEVSVNENERQQLDLMKRTFSEDPEIRKHIADPEMKWDAMLKLNDGGMKSISDYLETISSPEIKQKRIIEQLNQAITAVSQRFESWYQSDGEEEVNKKQTLAKTIVNNILGPRKIVLGEILRLLQLPQDTIFSLYHSADLDEENEKLPDNNLSSTGFGMNFDDSSSFDLFGEPPVTDVIAEKKETVTTESKSRFAQAVFKAWVEHMRGFTSDEHTMRFFQFSAENREGLDNLISEIITAATRLKLQQRLSDAITKNESAGYKRDQLAESQVFTVHTQISDFLAWLGFINMPVTQRPASRHPQNAGLAIFEVRKVEELNGLPKLSNQTHAFTDSYIYDWFVALGETCVQNAGHSAGREIDATQNAKLGEILRQFTTAKIK